MGDRRDGGRTITPVRTHHCRSRSLTRGSLTCAGASSVARLPADAPPVHVGGTHRGRSARRSSVASAEEASGPGGEGQQEGDLHQADRALDASGEELVFVDKDLPNFVPPRRRVGKVSVVLVSCAQDGGCCTTQYSLHSCRACAALHTWAGAVRGFL